MDAVTLLTTRYSSARLTEPAPSGEALAIIKQAALQVPDHGHLRPWRFVVVNGRKSLEKLGDVFAEAAESPITTRCYSITEFAIKSAVVAIVATA